MESKNPDGNVAEMRHIAYPERENAERDVELEKKRLMSKRKLVLVNALIGLKAELDQSRQLARDNVESFVKRSSEMREQLDQALSDLKSDEQEIRRMQADIQDRDESLQSYKRQSCLDKHYIQDLEERAQKWRLVRDMVKELTKLEDLES